MRPRQLFGVLVRLVGVWCLSSAIVEAIEVIAKLDGMPTGSNHTWQFSLIAAGGNLLAALILIGGADTVVKIAYPAPDEDEEARRF
jgi:hypothetical protein